MPVDSKGGERKARKSSSAPKKSKAKTGGAKRKPTPVKRTAPSFTSVNATSSAMSEEFQALGSEIGDLSDRVSLSSHRSAAADLDTGITELASNVADLRERGYVYKKFLERKVDTLDKKWADAEPELTRTLSRYDRELAEAYNALADDFNQAASRGGKAAHVSGLQVRVNEVESRISAADTALQGIYGNIRSTFYQTQSQVNTVVWLMDQLDVASFELLANENAIQAVKAHWWRDGDKDGPEGVLYLTDQRLLFEQKEKVATKKVLFITTESETVQELLFEVGLSDIEGYESSHKGIGGHQDHLDFQFSAGDFVNAHFHIDGQDSDEWAALIKRVLNGDIQKERFYPEGTDAESEQQALEEALSEAPANCEACGAPVEADIVRGQRSIECAYCGSVMRW